MWWYLQLEIFWTVILNALTRLLLIISVSSRSDEFFSQTSRGHYLKKRKNIAKREEVFNDLSILRTLDNSDPTTIYGV